MKIRILAFVFAIGTVFGQGRGAPPIKSPEVSADGKVTVRLRAPKATEVFVTGLGGRLAMQKDDQGVWSATTDTLKPDLYSYSFQVDGMTVTDPSNPKVVKFIPGPYNTWTIQMEISGNTMITALEQIAEG